MTIQDGINAILSMKDPTVRKGMQEIIDKFYKDNHLVKGEKISDIRRMQLSTLLANYLLKGVENNG